MAVGRGRIDECAPVSAALMDGSMGGDGKGIILPTVGFENPGATPDLRGVEANTGKMSDGGNSYDLPPQDGSMDEMDESFMGDDPHGMV